MNDRQANRAQQPVLSSPHQNRRQFVKTISASGLAWSIVLPPESAAESGKPDSPRIGRIVVDFDKCTGCRTCEAVCAQFNHTVEVDGEELPGLGNPDLSNIRVYHFNPDVDVPIVCVMCTDNPCVEACPVTPDDQGRRALYRDLKTQTIRNDPERCIKCGACSQACLEKRVGAIIPNRETGLPERMCTLCGGDPQCVKHCPYGALRLDTAPWDGKSFAVPPDKIAEDLADRWYGFDAQEGGSR